MRRLNARQVEAFRALMLTASTVRAAEIMHITQPAVSRLVREFQEAVELTLFERYGNRLKPTNDALALYAEVERSFVGLERIAQAALELRTRRGGTLRIAALPALCNGFLPRHVAAFLAEHPRLDVTLSGLASSSVVDWVASEQCDLGFAAAPVEHGAARALIMPAVHYVAVVPKGHRLAKLEVIRPKHFKGERFIALGATTPSRFRIDDVFAKYGVSPSTRVETPLSEIACALVAAGTGVSIVDPFTAEQYAASGVVRRRFEPAIEFQFAALHAARRELTAVAREFVSGFATFVERFRRAQDDNFARESRRRTPI